jgi:hypothetical protein
MKTKKQEQRNDYEDSDSDEQLHESDSPIDSELSDQHAVSNDENPEIEEDRDGDGDGFVNLAKQKKNKA